MAGAIPRPIRPVPRAGDRRFRASLASDPWFGALSVADHALRAHRGRVKGASRRRQAGGPYTRGLRPRSPIGRGKPLTRVTVWVRVPPGALVRDRPILLLSSARRGHAILTCPAVSGRPPRRLPAIRAEYVLKLGAAEGRIDPTTGSVLLPVEALRVDLEQDLHGVAGPLGHLVAGTPPFARSTRPHAAGRRAGEPSGKAASSAMSAVSGRGATPGRRCSWAARRRAHRRTTGHPGWRRTYSMCECSSGVSAGGYGKKGVSPRARCFS